MVKKRKAGSLLLPPPPPPPPVEWDPNTKEPWLIEFEKKAVNDEKWSCIVTAAVQAEAQDEEFIQIFNEYAVKGLRKSIKTITMADVIQLFKGVEEKVPEKKKEKKKGEKVVPIEKKSIEPPPCKNKELLDLAAKYATISDSECKLPPDLMAAVLKSIILNIREENYEQRVRETINARRMREEKIKLDFIRSLKPYKESDSKKLEEEKDFPNESEVIDDAPLGGPDLYIILINFYDPLLFAQLLEVKVPFVAIFKVAKGESSLVTSSWTSAAGKNEAFARKRSLGPDFWNCVATDTTPQFKNIAIMPYEAPTIRQTEKVEEVIFDELSWLLYVAYSIYREHQTYLQELYVQRLILSLEPLNLSQCHVYNKLCDALVSGGPNTIYFVLYAMIEQVVAGVPDTKSIPLTYSLQLSDLFPTNSDWHKNPKSKNKNQPSNVSHILEESEKSAFFWEIPEWSGTAVADSIQINIDDESSLTTHPSQPSICESHISEDLINEVLKEKKTEAEIRKEKKWKAPKLCFYGDYIDLDSYHCDPRIFDPSTIFDRFLKNSVLPRLWSKYPDLPSEERAFFNYHFYSFWKISNQSVELLKLKIFFVLSMNLIGITKAYMFRGEEESRSELLAERLTKLSKVRFHTNDTAANVREKNFSDYFFKRLIANSYFRRPRKAFFKLENLKQVKGSLGQGSSYLIGKVPSQFNIHIHRDGGLRISYRSRRSEDSSGSSYINNREKDKEFMTFVRILDCLDISGLTDFQIIGDEEGFLNLVHHFNFFEELEPSRMIQQLLEAKSNYNTTQCSYFPPTDTMIMITYNDFDYRGVFFNCFYSSLTTPVCLRDFFKYVYPEIGAWLIKKAKETAQLRKEFKEKIKTLEEKADNEYLYNLKKKFCHMSQEEKTVFLETGSITNLQAHDLEDYIQILSLRFTPEVPNRTSFIATNFGDVRVETRTEVKQYHSKDGTEVSVTQDFWLDQPLTLLTLCIKHSPLIFHYYQYLGVEDINTSFTLRTNSDIIFSFFKDDQTLESSQTEVSNNFNYHVDISWPTGLIIQEKTIEGKDLYVKQSYIRVYRRYWDISEEQCRCFLPNGQILIFKENSDVEILCGSGAKYSCFESLRPENLGSNKKETSSKEVKKISSPSYIQRYEITTSLGETWERVTKGPCKNKKRLINAFKVYMGVDPQTQEVFYKREDGVYCMLWPNGKLVTNFPDGTKITSVPLWDDSEVTTEWTDEEKCYFQEMEAKLREELADHQPKSRTILRKFGSSQTSKLTFELKSFPSFEIEGFVSISCHYLMEHPKYASVVFDPQNSLAKIKMPEDLSIQIYPGGNYKVQQDTKVLNVQGTTVQFYSECSVCNDRSISTINLDSSQILCEFVDFLKNKFRVQRDGSTNFEEHEKTDHGSLGKDAGNGRNDTQCVHVENVAFKQRCFVFQRDLSGIEFLHADSLLPYCQMFPPETHFDLHSTNRENPILAHTFSSPSYKVGYENWVMDYEDNTSSFPTNLKKKNLKEIGVKENSNKVFVYPFPKGKSSPKYTDKEDIPTCKVEMPKVIVTRIIKCLAEEPERIIDELKEFISVYQKRVSDICNEYKTHRTVVDLSKNEKQVKMKLLKIALTLNQGCHAYPNLSDIIPSTEKDIHKAGHFIDLMETFKNHGQVDLESLPYCKQIPRPLPRPSNLDCIYEESETSNKTS